MKSVIVSACIAVLIVASSIACELHINTVSQKLLSINERVTQAVEDENYESAVYILNEISDYVNKKEDILSVTDNHEVVHNIEVNTWELYEFIEGGQKTDALSKCRVLSFLFEQLPENYKIKWNNIL
ncbi:MAG: DUF4363 family protein [Firmicutes bacterium]|nr:DUF4363 family protein [Bacillota bacterium]